MKTFATKITASLLLVFFMLGFVNVADAAFAGKKNLAKTESVAKNNTEITQQLPANAPSALPASDTDTLLLVILCFILPPLAVYLKYDEIGTPFIVNLILTLIFWIPGVIHALYHVLK
jgi:uncharacterized membrane protein YqaE (UPF0057 family)